MGGFGGNRSLVNSKDLELFDVVVESNLAGVEQGSGNLNEHKNRT
jgi:hypothetical protein